MGYRKFAYWLEERDFGTLDIGPGKSAPPLFSEIHIPCKVLKSSLEVGVVHPSAWLEGFCKRRTSWYQGSGKTGQYLVVSSDPIEALAVEPEVTIEDSSFRPETLPSHDDLIALARSPLFERRKPVPWDQIEDREREVYRRWHERWGGASPFDFEDVFLFHSANHANFLEPRFFIEAAHGKIPYSISDSLHSCSSCLEFFNVLGEEWPVKYVVPCLGAVQFARLPKDRYLKVTSKKTGTEC